MKILPSTDIWSFVGNVDIICVTTNLFAPSGRATMGAGIAKQAKLRYPGCDLVLGRSLAQRKFYPTKIAEDSGTAIYSFPTKPREVSVLSQILPGYRKHWQGKPLPGWMAYSSLELIKSSAESLKVLGSNLRIALPKPGCGHGGLNWNDVSLELNKILDSDRFIVCV